MLVLFRTIKYLVPYLLKGGGTKCSSRSPLGKIPCMWLQMKMQVLEDVVKRALRWVTLRMD
jgi:hypothetical protein